MKMSHKLIILFSLLTFMTTLATSAVSYVNSMNYKYDSTQDTLVALGEKMIDEIEQYVKLMDYAIDTLTSNVAFMNAMDVASTQGDQEDLGETMAAQTIMSRQLYQEPLVQNFYRVSVFSRNGFFLTSHFEKTASLISKSDETEETIASLDYLKDIDANPLQRHLVAPHLDTWSSTYSVPVFSAVQAMILHGKFIGYVEICEPIEELSQIFTVGTMEGCTAQAIFDNGDTLFRADNDTAAYATTTPCGMNRIVTSDGNERLFIGLHSDELDLNIYVAQDLSVFNKEANLMLLTNLGVSFIILCITIAFVTIFSLQLTRSIRKLAKKMSKLNTSKLIENPEEQVNTMVSRPRDKEVYHLESALNSLISNLQVSIKNEISTREGALQAQLNALQTQINPHFIYNTLNIISAKGMESNNEEIVDICDQFAQMLRYSTDVRSRNTTLHAELQNARRYLMLSKARYEDNLQYYIEVPSQLETLQLPKLTLQPILENALTHGFFGPNEVRVITIRGTVIDNILHLIIQDNGRGFSADMLSQLNDAFALIDCSETPPPDTVDGHIGLINTYLRLHYYSKGKMHMKLRNDNGAVVELTMPCERSTNNV